MIIDARAYERVSLEEQARLGYSMQAQRTSIDDYAKRNNWRIIKHYTDEGFSAKDTNRPALQSLLRDVAAGEIIVVYKLDRLTRSIRDIEMLLDLAEKRNVYLRSVSESVDTSTANGRLFLRMSIEIAQWERETISERSSFGRLAKASTGRYTGSTAPFGYRYVESERIGKRGTRELDLEPDPERAHIVQELYRRYLAGTGMRTLCHWLNGMKIQTAHSTDWTATTISRMLANPVYMGSLAYGKRSKRKTVQLVQGTHDPLISVEMWTQAQDAKLIRRKLAPRLATGLYPLSGVVKCGTCGSSLLSYRAKTYVTNGRYGYRCMNYGNGGTCRNFGAVISFKIEPLVVEKIVALGTPAGMERFISEYERSLAKTVGNQDAERSRLQTELAKAKVAVERWTLPYEQQELDWATYQQRVSPHQERIKALQTQLDALGDMPTIPAIKDLEPIVYDFGHVWELATPQERKALLQRFVQAFQVKILFHGDTRSIEFVPDVESQRST